MLLEQQLLFWLLSSSHTMDNVVRTYFLHLYVVPEVFMLSLNRIYMSWTSQGLKLDYLKTTSPEALNKMDWDILQTMIGFWVQHIEVAVKVLYASERRLSEQVLGHGRYIECFYKVARIGMLQFISFGEGVACGHRTPEKLFKLLDMFEVLDKCMPIVNVVFEGECCLELRSRIRELQKMVGQWLLPWKIFH